MYSSISLQHKRWFSLRVHCTLSTARIFPLFKDVGEEISITIYIFIFLKILKQISIIITTARSFSLFDGYLYFKTSTGLELFFKLLHSPNRDQTSIVHLPRSLPILKRSSHCHSCRVIFPIHQLTQFRLLVLIHPPCGHSSLRHFSQMPVLIQATTSGRVTVDVSSQIFGGGHSPAEGHTCRRVLFFFFKRSERNVSTSCRRTASAWVQCARVRNRRGKGQEVSRVRLTRGCRAGGGVACSSLEYGGIRAATRRTPAPHGRRRLLRPHLVLSSSVSPFRPALPHSSPACTLPQEHRRGPAAPSCRLRADDSDDDDVLVSLQRILPIRCATRWERWAKEKKGNRVYRVTHWGNIFHVPFAMNYKVYSPVCWSG